MKVHFPSDQHSSAELLSPEVTTGSSSCLSLALSHESEEVFLAVTKQGGDTKELFAVGVLLVNPRPDINNLSFTLTSGRFHVALLVSAQSGFVIIDDISLADGECDHTSGKFINNYYCYYYSYYCCCCCSYYCCCCYWY